MYPGLQYLSGVMKNDHAKIIAMSEVEKTFKSVQAVIYEYIHSFFYFHTHKKGHIMKTHEEENVRTRKWSGKSLPQENKNIHYNYDFKD